MNLHTGQRLFLARQRQRQHDFQAFLEFIRHHYRGRQVVLLLDENPSHTAKASQQLAEELQIELLWLPKRAPELNPMEKLWGQGKGIISANLQYPTIDDHLQALIQYLECLTNWEARYTAGILSQEFWLKSVL
jgi:transposase